MRMQIFAVLILLSSSAFGQQSTSSKEPVENLNFVRFNPEYSAMMLNENTTDINQKQLYLLQARKNKNIKDHSLYLGARTIALLDYQTSNVNSKFGWLMRLPTARNQIGLHVSEAALHSVQVGVTGTVTSWMTLYSNLLYDPQQSFGAGSTITGLSRNQVQVRKAYVVIGDLSRSPLYASLGKLESPFGLTDSVDPFTSSTVWHAFAGLSYGVIASYYKSGLNLSAELAQGGAQFRSMNTSVEETAVPSRLNNYVLDANYDLHLSQISDVLFGASYLEGSSYCQDFGTLGVKHFGACKENNPAFDFYGRLNWNRFSLQGEFAKTLKVWPGTHNPNAPLNRFPASKVTAFDVGSKYSIPIANRDYTLSASFSSFIAGPKGSPWHRQDQTVVGFSTIFRHSIMLFSEFIRVDGYVPLNFISGVDPASIQPSGTSSDAGSTHSSQGVHNNIFVIGVDASI